MNWCVRVLTLVAAMALFACSSGAGKTPSPDGRSDYFDRVFQLICIGQISFRTAGPTPDARTIADSALRAADSLDKLRAPPDIAAAQQRYVDALRAAHDVRNSIPEVRSLQPSFAGAQKIRDADDRGKEWAALFKKIYGVQFFRNEGSSMEPALRTGTFVAAKDVVDPVQRWQLLVFKFPLDESVSFIKRVAALPGETVQVRDGQLVINGAPLADDHYYRDPANYEYGPKTVPADSYFVLGDNRRNSFDSHAWGASCAPDKQCDFVPKANILGVVDADSTGCASVNSALNATIAAS